MTIYASTPANIAALMSAATGVPLASADLMFGIPRASTPTESANYGKNTAVVVSARPEASSRVTGVTTIVYDRLDLKALENYNLTNHSLSDNANMTVWLPEITGYLGIILSADDLLDHPTVLLDGRVTLWLEATVASLGWTGSAKLNFSAYPDISTAFSTNLLYGF